VEGLIGAGGGRDGGIEGNSRGQQGQRGERRSAPLKSGPFFPLAHILARLYSWLISNQRPFVSIRQHLHRYRQGQITQSKEGGRDEEGRRGRPAKGGGGCLYLLQR